MASWKAAQSKKQQAKKIRLALTVLALFLGLLILAQVIKFTHTLFSPWNLASSPSRTSWWNGDFNINIVTRAKSISLLSYSPQNQKVTITTIPDQTYLELAHGFGKWQIRAVYDLGGHQLLEDSLTAFFGLPIEGFMEGDLDSLLSKSPFSLINILQLKTDLTLFELLKLKMGLAAVRFDKIKEIDLAKIGLEKETLADGTDILTADPQRLDSILSDMIDPLVQSEHKTIAIFNSTDHPGLAQKAARLVANIGGDVIIITNGQNKFNRTQISGEQSKTLHRLKQIFRANDTIDLKDEDLVSSRAQINLFLGEDYFDR